MRINFPRLLRHLPHQQLLPQQPELLQPYVHLSGSAWLEHAMGEEGGGGGSERIASWLSSTHTEILKTPPPRYIHIML